MDCAPGEILTKSMHIHFWVKAGYRFGLGEQSTNFRQTSVRQNNGGKFIPSLN